MWKTFLHSWKRWIPSTGYKWKKLCRFSLDHFNNCVCIYTGLLDWLYVVWDMRAVLSVFGGSVCSWFLEMTLCGWQDVEIQSLINWLVPAESAVHAVHQGAWGEESKWRNTAAAQQTYGKGKAFYCSTEEEKSGGWRCSSSVERWTCTPLRQVQFLGAVRDFSPSVNFQWRLFYSVCTPPRATMCINICAHFKGPVVHIRVWWIMQTLKHAACTVCLLAWLCRSWLSQGKTTGISHRRNPNGTIQL